MAISENLLALWPLSTPMGTPAILVVQAALPSIMNCASLWEMDWMGNSHTPSGSMITICSPLPKLAPENHVTWLMLLHAAQPPTVGHSIGWRQPVMTHVFVWTSCCVWVSCYKDVLCLVKNQPLCAQRASECPLGGLNTDKVGDNCTAHLNPPSMPSVAPVTWDTLCFLLKHPYNFPLFLGFPSPQYFMSWVRGGCEPP